MKNDEHKNHPCAKEHRCSATDRVHCYECTLKKCSTCGCMILRNESYHEDANGVRHMRCESKE
jgi:hypothetical protein